jgi:lipoprotein-releasing system permease protein
MLQLSLRYLKSKPKQTLLTLLGIILGTAAFVAISGMMLGFQLFIIDQLVNNDAHLRISARDEPVSPSEVTHQLFGDTPTGWTIKPSGRRGELNIRHVGSWLERLKADPRVEAYAPQLVVRGVVSFGKQTFPINIRGIEPEKQIRVSTLASYVESGKITDLSGGGSRIFIGGILMENLGATEGDTILISNGKTAPTPFKIQGRFLLGVRSLDESLGYVSLSQAQAINQSAGTVSDLAVRFRNVESAKTIAEEWAKLSGDKVQSWDQTNEGILSVFKTQDIVRNSMTISILLVAGFGIFNILNMTVTQRRREIAILRSMGYTPKDIVLLFFNQGLFLGIVGGLLGVILGYLACKYMATIDVSPSRGLGKGKMMVAFLPSIYVKGFLLAVASASIASVFPARSAGSLRPMEIIRAE